MGAEIAALAAYFGLTGFFATIGAVFAAWMAWRIVEKAGVPGWVGLGAVLLTLTGIGSIVPLILLWVFAFMRWPRDEMADEISAQKNGQTFRDFPVGTQDPPRPDRDIRGQHGRKPGCQIGKDVIVVEPENSLH